jgi:hypothetical protein
LEIDVSQLDKVNKSINRLIESKEAAHEREEMWAESVRKYKARHTEERRLGWIDWHRHRVALFESLAAEHREELGKLIDQGTSGG